METTEQIIKAKWVIDPTVSEIKFRIKNVLFPNINGSYKVFGASIDSQQDNFHKSEINVWIDSDSVETGDQKRDEKVKEENFFDVKNYKQILFTGTVEEVAEKDGFYVLEGNLIIKGIAKKLKLDVINLGPIRDIRGMERMGFSINGKMNRKDWDLNWNPIIDTGGFLLSEEVIINCEVQLIQQI